MTIEVGKPLPEDLRVALHLETNMNDWGIAAGAEGKVSAFTIRDVLKGFSVSENSISTVYKLVEIAKAKIVNNEEKLLKHKSLFEAVELSVSNE